MFDNRSTGEGYSEFIGFINSVAVCLAEFI